MKKTFAFAALAAAVAGPAMAESSITVYGRLNLSAEHQKFGDTKQNTLQNSSSRIGFKGNEDLGGGMYAGFLIESGFNPATGAANATFWGRESHVDLGGAWGKVRLGNMGPTMAYFTLADYISMHNHDTGSSADQFYLYPGSATKMVAYTSPSFGGVTVDAQISEGSPTTKRTKVLTANYEGGPLHVGAAYENSSDAKEFGARVAYDIGAFTLGAYAIRDQDIASVSGADRTSFRVAGMYTMGATELHVNVGRAGKLGGIADTAATQYTLGVNQNLSKRTKIYAFYTKVNNQASAGYVTDTLGADFSSLALGIRHNF